MPFKHNRKQLISFKHQLLLGCFSLNLSSIIVWADELDTLQFRASIDRAYDDNLFRRANNETSEQITHSTIGVKFDKSYSLQRVILDVWVIDNKYRENEYLDFVGKNYSAAYLWTLTPSLTGTLSSRQTESMNNFGDFLSTQQNVRTFITNEFTAKYSPHKVWGLILGVSQNKLENSQTFTAITDFDAKGVDYGVSYDFSSGAYLKFLAHNRSGGLSQRPLDPVNAFDNGYKENEYEIDLYIPEEGKSSLSAKVGHITKEYDNFSVRDYKAFVGNVNYNLILTGKLKSNFVLSRSASPFETSNSTYSISDTFTTRVTYDLTSKIEAGLNLRYSERDFEGRERFDTSGRKDKEHSYGVNINWNPTKNVGLSLRSVKSYRDSTVARFDYDDTLTTINLELKI
ncbi:MAG TPA: XrtB/PEP-CTERM-associated polysaccharide biosynthesis outer membrane protein EpsL [Methylophilus sp.]|uniref:XrtB/PEP-CTERM-associated polysaccharide biosynthesis outer membrane protein EpsL n=1 Tax=Methylophilus sp. TaxID=29541 RepID=UPI002B879A8F|nr:XrtB/PEP-CTERM-associated polysaccharide biosynthesis outer membrane protein EpsL [Methylophilus sp.]HSH88025.1 XrtB/PEP-CTERM-associated polysaccharide biosynthesis outer membrane protein EpsL [Methylophilus sp.]